MNDSEKILWREYLGIDFKFLKIIKILKFSKTILFPAKNFSKIFCLKG